MNPLTLYRRHTNACAAKRSQHDRDYRKCRCVIHVSGSLGGKAIRQSLHTREWETASRQVMEAEAKGSWDVLPSKSSNKIDDAIRAFLNDAESEKGRNLSTSTLSKYKTLFNRLAEFSRNNGLVMLEQLTTEHLRQFKETWPTGPRATNHNITRLRAWLKFCLENEWIARNPALALRPLKHIQDAQKLPFTQEELAGILAAANSSPKVEALILLMRHTGLRISDAVFLKPDRVKGNDLQLHLQKTGAWVSIPLHQDLLPKLSALSLYPNGYYFIEGSTRLGSATDRWRRKLNRIFRSAGIPNATPHRFRHTFAVDLLTKGVDIKTVSLLLGHSSVTITEKFYAAWIPGRQSLLSDQVRKTWDKAA